MKLYTDRQIKLIVNNIVKVIKTKNSLLLSKQAYNYLYLASGFIAHYNLYGFQDAYKNTGLLKQAILDNQGFNQWQNFRQGEQNYDYYMQKRDIYNLICTAIKNL